MYENVCTCCTVMDLHPCSGDRLQIHRNPDHAKVVTEEELINKLSNVCSAVYTDLGVTACQFNFDVYMCIVTPTVFSRLPKTKCTKHIR